MPRRTVYLKDTRLEEYLSLKGGATQRAYRGAFKLFLNYYQSKRGEEADFNTFLEAIFDNLKKPLSEQRRIIEPELVAFIEYLKMKGFTNKSIRVYLAGIQNYLKYNNIIVSMSFVGNLPQPTTLKINSKHEWTLDQVKDYMEHAKTHREKAIILCLFQSGMGINELLSLDYGDVQEEFEKKILPIHLRLIRKKTGVEYRTFFGRDAAKYLGQYLETRQDLHKDTPLFTKTASNTERLTKEAVEGKFREITGTVDFLENENTEGYNSARPHSLRAAFRSRLTGKMDRDLIEFFMGHALGEQVRTYINLTTEDLRELYANYEKLLSIEKTSREELEERKGKVLKVSDEYEKRIGDLETTIDVLQSQNSSLATENLEIKNRLSKIEEMADEILSLRGIQKLEKGVQPEPVVEEVIVASVPSASTAKPSSKPRRYI